MKALLVTPACLTQQALAGLLAPLSSQQPPPALLSAAADAICGWDKLQEGEAKHLVSLGWAMAKMNCKDRRVFGALAAALVPHAAQLSANQVSVVLWAFGRAAFRDQHLLQQLASRTQHLLQQQQQQQQRQQDGEKQIKLGRAAARRLKHAQFDSTALSNMVWGMSVLQWQEPQVMAAAANVAAGAPLVYDFKPWEVANLLKGFAAAASAAAQGGDGVADSDASSSSSSSSIADSDAALHQQVQEALEQTSEAAAAAAAAVAPNRQLALQLWPAACAVASAALRRLDEAMPSCVVRMMWGLAALHQAAVSSQQGPPLSAAALEDGRVVFRQLAAALQQQWSRQAAHPVGLTVAAWSLVMAQGMAAAAGSSVQGGEAQQLLGQFAAAVAALADAAQRLQVDAVGPGQLPDAVSVADVSKMLPAFGRMQVTNEALYQALLRHWTPQQLQACSSEDLIGAARALTWLAKARPGLVSSGVLPGDLWELLLQLCLKRWGRLSDWQRALLQPVAANMPAEVAAQHAEVAAEFKRVVAGAKQ
ncbi:hypothetical protein OEZ85_011893 [Tetradesmus obliquus]|uniref:Uncharacterized protein n=1 Tax=Tetradesmus obliquus TaxID=3088 RepID=A0ABY8TRP3_TETOB|nr:hypothetical protein OEZ85_011893 [Tetradesmus obliquus]